MPLATEERILLEYRRFILVVIRRHDTRTGQTRRATTDNADPKSFHRWFYLQKRFDKEMELHSIAMNKTLCLSKHNLTRREWFLFYPATHLLS